MKNLSIIVPVWNEEQNIALLVEEITSALTGKVAKYEIIFIDDHSTDNTYKLITSLAEHHPIRLFSKLGLQGKAYSLLEGFKHAQYDLLCMIDADLQYSPKYIPAMVHKIEKGADIVVANRHTYKGGLVRKICSKTFNVVFVQLLHGLHIDAQSGLKVFRRSITEHIDVHPSPWTFDLEFLLKARKAHDIIESVNIAFIKRHAGESKISMFKSAYEIGLSAIKLRLFMTYSPKEKNASIPVQTSKLVH